MLFHPLFNFAGGFLPNTLTSCNLKSIMNFFICFCFFLIDIFFFLVITFNNFIDKMFFVLWNLFSNFPPYIKFFLFVLRFAQSINKMIIEIGIQKQMRICLFFVKYRWLWLFSPHKRLLFLLFLLNLWCLYLLIFNLLFLFHVLLGMPLYLLFFLTSFILLPFLILLFLRY